LGVFQLAVRNLRRRRTRTILTILGVVVAISFTVGLLSVSEGFMISFEDAIRKRGVDIFVWHRDVKMIPLPGAVYISFPEEYVDQISTYENVEVAVPILEVMVFRPDEEPALRRLPLFAHGIPPRLFRLIQPYLEVNEGRFLEEGDGFVVLLGYAFAENEGLSINDTISIMGENFTVVGILKRVGGFDDSLAYAPLKAVQKASRQEGLVNLAMIRVKDIDRVGETAKAIEKDFPNLSSSTLDEVLAHMSELLGMARAIHFSVASVSLLIGLIFVFCTMLMAVSERVHEIGVMRAIGVSRTYIFKLIATESVIISLIGGTIGCMGGYGLSRIINLVLAEFVGIAFFETAVSPRLVLAGLVIALCVGGLAGLYPAWKASKQNIVEALRYE